MNEISHAKFGIGAPLRRIEDDALLTGKGNYADDRRAEGMLFGYVLRSPHAHAKFKFGDLETAKSAPGVHLVLTAADIAHIKPLPCFIGIKLPPGASKVDSLVPVLCRDTVRHVGDGVAFIVADTLLGARDAAEMIEVEYEPLPAIADTAKAAHSKDVLVYSEAGSNVAFVKDVGDAEATKAAFARAAKVSEIRVHNNRLIANYMEPRACMAEWLADEDRWSVWIATQGVHGVRDVLADILGVGKDKIRVRTGDVGGGFGTKTFTYREYPLCLEAAKRLGRPVKWTSDRAEHFLADAHGRDNVTVARMAMDKDGKFLAMRVELLAAMGAYLHCYGPFIPALGLAMTPGLYDIAAIHGSVQGIYSNTTPVDAYRGAGRPEAAYVVERLVDKCAADLGISRDEIRRRNFIRPNQMPYTSAGGRKYDTGEFDGHMRQAMTAADWQGFDRRNKEAASRGKFRGIGMATYIEACAFAGSEPAFIELRADGEFDLKIGTQTNGQGHATAYAQIAAEKLNIAYDKIHVRQGDTDELASGGGTGGSRSVPLGGVSSARAGEAMAVKLKKLAGDHLEASPRDIELADGEARVSGTDKHVSFKELYKAAGETDRKAEGNFEQDEATYPNGTHVCEVEIDPDTGVVDVVAYTIVDDFGVTVNPVLLAGQVHGGVAQGIGQCLTEHTVYDDDGQLLSATLMDYGVPRADDLPSFSFQTRNVPSTTNALGIKGAGEAGTIGACPAVMNAVCHALKTRFGIDHIDMPATPQRVWQAIQTAG
jgi:carbon-monoxide dehydrogenase large subunit